MNFKAIYNQLAGNKIRRRRLMALVMTICYMAALAYLSLFPLSEGMSESRGALRLINLLHIPAYALLTAIWVAYLRLWWRRISDWRVLVPAFIITALFGSAVELAQYFVPGREANFGHMALNIGGALWTVVAILIFPTAEEMASEKESKL
jgi:VanZ family protein